MTQQVKIVSDRVENDATTGETKQRTTIATYDSGMGVQGRQATFSHDPDGDKYVLSEYKAVVNTMGNWQAKQITFTQTDVHVLQHIRRHFWTTADKPITVKLFVGEQSDE